MIIHRIVDSFRKQAWFTVFIEFLIVVLGIYVGLQVDDWNKSRQDHIEVSEYLSRIKLDLDTDLKFYHFILKKAKLKNDALQNLKLIILEKAEVIEDVDHIFDLIEKSSSLGWEFPEVQTATFKELQSSGKLGLLDNSELRKVLAFYYEESLHRSDRIESRITGYSAMIYEITDPAILVDQLPEVLSKPEIKKFKFNKKAAASDFLKRADNNQFLRLLRAEQHYTIFMTKLILEQLDQTRNLQQAIAKFMNIKTL